MCPAAPLSAVDGPLWAATLAVCALAKPPTFPVLRPACCSGCRRKEQGATGAEWSQGGSPDMSTDGKMLSELVEPRHRWLIIWDNRFVDVYLELPKRITLVSKALFLAISPVL